MAARLAALLAAIGRMSAAPAPVAELRVEGKSPGWCVFTEGEHPLLRLTLTLHEGEWRLPRCGIVIYDFWHHRLAGVRSQMREHGNQLDVVIGLQEPRIGWFSVDLAVSDAGQKVVIERKLDYGLGENPVPQFLAPMFAIVPAPRSVTDMQDSPVAVDALVSSSRPAISDQLQTELVHRLGVRWARDRISWTETEPKPDVFDWVGREGAGNLARHGQRVQQNASGLQRDGVRVLQVFHGIPGWAHTGPEPSFTSFPDDLRTIYRWTKAAATKLGPSVPAWSIWNEEDILFFSSEPPDEYAAFVKAAALGLRDAQPRPLILLGAFARDPRVGNYAPVLFANGVRPYVDCYDFHCYAPVSTGGYANVIRTNLAIAQQAGFEPSSVWLSETGSSYSKAAPPSEVSAREAQARYLVDAYAAGIASGIRHLFWFSMRPTLPGNGRQFGMVNANLEPFPVYSAMAAMAQALGQASFLGRGRVGDVPILLFQDGKTEAALVQSTTPSTELESVPGATGWIDVMGGRHPFEAGKGAGTVRVSNEGWPFYVRGTAWLSRVAAPADSVPAPGRPAPVPSRIVMRVRFPREFMAANGGEIHENFDGIPITKWAPRGYLINPGGALTASVELYNFARVAVAGTVRPELPSGFRVEPASAEYRIGPDGRTRVNFSIQAAAPAAGQKDVLFQFTTTDSRDGSIAKSVSQWTCELGP